MKTLTLLRALGPVDLKNVRRDALLAWIPLLVIFMALVLRAGVPALTTLLRERADFDLTPYYPLIMSGFMLTAPGMIGMVVGFLLLDERDDRVLSALMVTPIPLTSYLAYRVAVPVVVGFVVTLAAYPLVGLLLLPLSDLIVVSLLGALTAPQVALLLATLAENKVAGFAVIKVLNSVQLLPIVAYFVQPPLHWLAGVLPAFWALKTYWLAAAGEPYWGIVAVGLVVNIVWLLALVKRFEQVAHR